MRMLKKLGESFGLMNERQFSIEEIGAAHALVESGALGRVVVEL
jgi:hypothetical protein